MKRNPLLYLFSGTILLLLLFPGILVSQNVSISETPTTAPDANAMLDIVSSTKGLLIPRVALTALTNRAPCTLGASTTESMLVYNTNGTSPLAKGFYYWSGSQWVPVGRVGWALEGNDITLDPNYFLGTTSNHDLIIKTNNTEKMRVLKTGEVGIGLNNPNEKLVVLGNIKAGSATPNAMLGTFSGLGNSYAAFWKDAATSYTLATDGTHSYLNAPTASGDIYFRANNADKAFLEGSNGYFGIGTITPAQKLDVVGNVQFSQALMPNALPGTTGDVLTSQGANTAPVWKSPGELIKAFGEYSTRTLINSTSFMDVTGLSVSVSVTRTSLLLITTYGAVETVSTNSSGGTGSIIQIFQKVGAGAFTGLPYGFQTIDVANTSGYTQLVTPWSITTFLENVAPGNYTYKVMARKYIGSDFYAGGSMTSPQGSEGAITILVIPQ